jgi:(p)ppGpp synthase/HD superfamily hydrolase
MLVAVDEPSGGRAHAIAFLLDAYAGARTKPGKGLPHAQAVADVLREAGYEPHVQVAGLLHDIVEDTDRNVDDVRERFGDTVAELVAQLTEDDSIRPYARRRMDRGSPRVAAALSRTRERDRPRSRAGERSHFGA